MFRPAKAVGALLALAVVASACSSGPSPAASSGPPTTTTAPSATTTTSATLTKAEAASKYLAIVAPANAAITTFKGSPNVTTNSEAAAEAQPVVTALQGVIQGLLALGQQYPPADTDLKAEVSAASTLSGDLESIGSTNALNISSWEEEIAHDGGVFDGTVATVRSDLGLPPAS
ncbi:MAG: hypothetical protein ACRD6W_15710 [Nitrososphaerales archaeon]